MRRRLIPVLLVLVSALVAAPGASAVETMRLDDPITDNYKATFNGDPNTPELRTWLSTKRIVAAGTTWAPRSPGAIEFSAASSLEVLAADGRTGTLAAAVASGPMTSLFQRIDPVEVESRGRWGPLGAVTDRTVLRSTPVRLSLALRGADDALLATGVVEYRHDAALAAVTSDHVEYNGPGGRWYVGGVGTRTNWEPVPAAPPVLIASAAAVPPRVTAIGLPLRTTKRLVSMTVRGRAGSARIAHVRVRIGSAGWGRWVTTRASYSVTLPRGVATRLVRVQLRAADGRVSAVAGRRIRCVCS